MMNHSVGSVVGQVVASGAGHLFGVLFALMARLRPTLKPLHPKGVQFLGTVYRSGTADPWGVPWLDEHGLDPVLVRFSRSVGLPAFLPDIHGLALRIDDSQGSVDVLFATTGRGRVSRFLLTPRRSPRGIYTTLMPYQAAAGPVLLLAELFGDTEPPVSNRFFGLEPPMKVRLSAAIGAGPWREFGQLQITEPILRNDPPVSFDPILNQMNGLPNYQWARRIREKAYSVARAARDADHEQQTH